MIRTTPNPQFDSGYFEVDKDRLRQNNVQHPAVKYTCDFQAPQGLETSRDVEEKNRRNSWDGTLRPDFEFEDVTSWDLKGKMCGKCKRNSRMAYIWNPQFLCVPLFEWLFPMFVMLLGVSFFLILTYKIFTKLR
ncbi:hypothetical protein NHQ30_003412 [Ciborinia camelliae]|nr:hypothetical protein NHQ30_003412 [Ciborinia camelliae]